MEPLMFPLRIDEVENNMDEDSGNNSILEVPYVPVTETVEYKVDHPRLRLLYNAYKTVEGSFSDGTWLRSDVNRRTYLAVCGSSRLWFLYRGLITCKGLVN